MTNNIIMQTPQMFKLLALAASVLVSLLAGNLAQASTISVTDLGGADGDYGGIGYIAPNPNSMVSGVGVYIGGDTFQVTGKSGPSTLPGIGGDFNAWCVDIYHWMNATSIYTVETGSDLATALNSVESQTGVTQDGATRVSKLIQLADEVYSTVTPPETSAAFQLAVWEISYGTPGNPGLYGTPAKPGVYQISAT